jgi:mannosyltransferase OCH1-like enzyme
MARACLLQLEIDDAAEHLRASAKLKVSRNLLRGWSLNISQNSLGQIFDEFALDRAVIAELKQARALPLEERLASLQQIVRAYPDNTAAALTLVNAMRQAGRFNDVAAVTDAAKAKPIPRRIIQFWDAVEPPEDIWELTRSWSAAHPDFEHVIFNDATAKAFLAAHYNTPVVHAFMRARHPAQRADIFRLAYLTINGGYYVDADDRCNRRVDAFVAPATSLVLYQENYGTIGNNFIGAMPGHPDARARAASRRAGDQSRRQRHSLAVHGPRPADAGVRAFHVRNDSDRQRLAKWNGCARARPDSTLGRLPLPRRL